MAISVKNKRLPTLEETLKIVAEHGPMVAGVGGGLGGETPRALEMLLGENLPTIHKMTLRKMLADQRLRREATGALEKASLYFKKGAREDVAAQLAMAGEKARRILPGISDDVFGGVENAGKALKLFIQRAANGLSN